MSLDTQFGATLKLPGSETASETEVKVVALKASIVDLAAGYEARGDQPGRVHGRVEGT